MCHTRRTKNRTKNAWRIIGGEIVPLGEFPHIVRMRKTLERHSQCQSSPCGVCGGTIIDDNWVLTAGHCCTTHEGSKQVENPSRLSFAVGAIFDKSCRYSGLCTGDKGSYYASDWNSGKIFNATEVILHPKYRPKPLKWDYCLVKVEGHMIEGNQDASAVILPEIHVKAHLSAESHLKIGSECLVVGWGQTENGLQSPDLLKASVKIYTNDYCIKETAYSFKHVGHNQFCAGLERGRSDSCQGDSGGPLYCRTSMKDEFKQYGIVSLGGKCGDANTPGIYAKTPSVSNWINQVTKTVNNVKSVKTVKTMKGVAKC